MEACKPYARLDKDQMDQPPLKSTLAIRSYADENSTSFGINIVDASFADGGQCTADAGHHESNVPPVFDWWTDSNEVNDAVVERLLPRQARGHDGRHRFH